MVTTRIRRPCPAKRHVPDEMIFHGPESKQRNWVFRFDNGYTVDLVRSRMTHGLEAALMVGKEFTSNSGDLEWFDRAGICRVDARMVDDLLDYVETLDAP